MVLICFLILSTLASVGSSPITGAPHPHEVVEDTGDSLWLEDFEGEHSLNQDSDNYDTLMQADSPHDDGNSHMTSLPVEDDDTPSCPPPPPDVAESLCHVTACDTDEICSKNKTRCCYNGCIYTCMIPVQPIPYIDWKREPQGRFTAGRSWLVGGQAMQEQDVEWCSTSEVYDDDEEPLLCPQGYTCHIEDLGDLERGIPNKGRCVRIATSPDDGLDAVPSDFRIASKTLKDNECRVKNNLYKNGDTFQYSKHNCQCVTGSIMCRVGRNPDQNKEEYKQERT